MGEFMIMKTVTGQIAATAAALLLSAGVANAADLFNRHDRGSMKDAPVAERERPKCGANVALTTDYIFRGETQSDHEPALQGGFDCDYRMFYAGVWASSVDGGDYDIEVDVYGGIKHKFGGVEADLGVIYYAYPDADDSAAGVDGPDELDYVEIKFGLSGDLTDKLSVSGTVYWSDDYFGALEETWVFEAGMSYALGTYGRFTPTFSALIGFLDDTEFGVDDYTYWNVGVEIGFDDKFALDLRYWGTDVDDNDALDDRFVATLSSSW